MARILIQTFQSLTHCFRLCAISRKAISVHRLTGTVRQYFELGDGVAAGVVETLAAAFKIHGLQE